MRTTLTVILVVLSCALMLLCQGTGYAAAWGPYNLTTGAAIYYPSNRGTSYNIGWYTTTAGTGASRVVVKAADTYMATMPAAAISRWLPTSTV